ncbi:class I SAM-dependent methyltransferase [Clostridium botulinum]|uniref:class I SAM-dependent methyltransferase n=1 Tax=Clostridium botulinum TaxID=1491 RepID=UPI00174B886D|nr:class I SAM-dependent methyltransferase [Clostridium botulinum]MBD5574043.1 class I SAM-dependent methyltransferase [Clostridium botulinum]
MKTFDKTWEQRYRTIPGNKYPVTEVVKFVFRNYKNREGLTALDYGCGSGGNHAWFLAREGFETFAIDGSETAIEKAKERMSIEDLNVNLKCCDAASTEFENDKFDVIIDTLTSTVRKSEIDFVLKECHRILKNEGRIISTYMLKKGIAGYGTGVMIEKDTYTDLSEGPYKNAGVVSFWDKSDIINVWAIAGFRDICVEELSFTDYDGKVNNGYYVVSAKK